MTKPYSVDLRVRVVEAVDEGATRQEAAERFGVSVSSAVRWHQAWRYEGTIAPLSDAAFEGGSAAAALAALRSDPRGLLVQEQSADDLQVGTGDTVKVLLARGTKRQRLRAFHVVGTFRRLPGFPPGADLVTTLRALHAATGPDDADFFLVRSAERGAAGLARAVGGLQSGAGRRDRLGLETTRTALDKDQSSLTALNVHGLVDLDSLYTLLMTAAGVAIFVAGIMLQRRREYIALLAHGLHVREVRALVLAEAALVAVSGLAAGLAVGGVIAALMVHVLRPLFILDPRLTLPARELAMLAGLALAAALLSALAATGVLRRLSPTEILRET